MVLNTAQMSLEDPCHPMPILIPSAGEYRKIILITGEMLLFSSLTCLFRVSPSKSMSIYIWGELQRSPWCWEFLNILMLWLGFRPRWDGKIHYH